MIRPYEKQDEAALLEWVRDKRTFILWSAGRYGSYPLTAPSLQVYFDNARQDPSFQALTFCGEEGSVLGHLQMRVFDEETIRFSSIVVDSSRRGQGLGKRLLTEAEDFAFSTLGTTTITISVFEDNSPAIALYTKLGYRILGSDTPAVYDGVCYPRLLMERRR